MYRRLLGLGLSEFQIGVLLATCEIPRGETRSYRQIALKVGRPHAYRAVGNALNSNPLPILIPCHRVIRSDGALGGYRLGASRKSRLLKAEGAL